MKVFPARDGVHKWVAQFESGRSTAFGAKGMDDYTITHDKKQRERYRLRHKKDLASRNPEKAGFLSYYLLWGKSTNLNDNIKAYQQRFKV
jgi:hypothetical protein